jgi:acyl-CoA synthetase (AMP-forming)/AMP-acid ligase II
VAHASSGNGAPLVKLRLWVCSGEALPATLGRAFFQTFSGSRTDARKTLCNFYGSTEVAGDVTCETFECLETFESKLNLGLVPLGSPIDNTKVYLVDVKDGQHLVSEGRLGEICVAGLNVAKGYLSQKDKNFVPNPFTKDKCKDLLGL